MWGHEYYQCMNVKYFISTLVILGAMFGIGCFVGPFLVFS